MVGICGAIGPPGAGVDQMVERLRWTGRERRFDYDDGTVRVSAIVHPGTGFDQPAASADGGALVWSCGSIRGVETIEGYEPRTSADPDDDALYCARLYDRYGLEFAARANGTYACVVYEPERDALSFISDRFGSYPLYWTRTEDGSLVFSTHAQAFVEHPSVDTAFHTDYLAEFCSLARVGGLKTPLRGIEQFPPSTITYVDLESREQQSKRYWTPTYEPLDKPFSYFRERFAELISTTMDERFDDDQRVGLLLSGGSDSRLLLGETPDDTIAYHLSDWMSEEARIAEQAALTADVEFRWLQRGDEYHERVLRRAAPIMNYYGRFEQAHVAGYMDAVADDVDVLVSGLYADTLFRGLAIPKYHGSLGPLGRLTLPTERSIDSVDEYLSLFPESVPPYVNVDRSLHELLRSNLAVQPGGSVVDHGVEYDSLRELVLYGDIYPLSNDPDLFYWSLEQTMPHWTPFLDNRLVDLALRMPIKYQLRRNISNAAIRRRSPELASIPNASTSVPLDHSFPIQYLGENLTALKRRYLRGTAPPQPYFSHHPWTNIEQLLRHHPFPSDTFQRHRRLVERSRELDWEGVRDCYDAHVDDESYGVELYVLLSLLEMPATERLVEGGRFQSETEPSVTDVPLEEREEGMR